VGKARQQLESKSLTKKKETDMTEMANLPSAYNKYDSDTQVSLSDLLDSIHHLVHILNGIKADILNGNYHQKQAELDYENLVHADGVDIFSALGEVSHSAWNNESDMVES